MSCLTSCDQQYVQLEVVGDLGIGRFLGPVVNRPGSQEQWTSEVLGN